MKRASRHNGFSLLEVIVGTVLIGMSSLFLLSAVRTYLYTSARAMAAENLSLVEKDVQQNVMSLLMPYLINASFAAAPCTYAQQPLNGVFANPLPSGITLSLVDNSHVPPAIPIASLYTQARTRCLALAHTGTFATANGIHFCALANGNWQSGGGGGGSAVGTQTILLEFLMTLHDEKGGGIVTCDRLVDYPMAPPPANSSALVAHLVLDVFTVNRRADTPDVASSPRVISRHSTGSMRNAWPYYPTDVLPIAQIALTGGGIHNTGRHTPMSSFLNAGFFGDCFGSCLGSQALSATYLTGSVSAFSSVVTGVYVQKRAADAGAPDLAALPAGMPGGYVSIGTVADCNGGACSGSQTFATKRQVYGSLGSGSPIASALWITPINSAAADGLMCPPDYTLVGRTGDCPAALPCVGAQNICVLFVPKP